MFRKAAAYCEREYDRWFILSAQHHLVHPSEVLDPYDMTLNTMGRLARAGWASRVRAQLCAQAEPVREQSFYLHAGKRYIEYVAPWLQQSGATVESPLAGLGIGQQLHDVARAFEFAKQRDPVDRCASSAVALRALFVGQHLAPTPGRIDGAE